MKKTELKKQHLIQLTFALVIMALVAFISSKAFFRIDLTSEHRYTLSGETKKILRNLDDIVYVKVYLDGDLPIGFKKLHNGIRETLDEFRVYGKDNLQYEFVNPSESTDEKTRNKVYGDLYRKGVQPSRIQGHDKEGGANEKIVFPGAVISYKGIEIPVGFLKNNPLLSAEENLNNSMQTVEYELIKTIYNLSNRKIQKLAFLEGQGELNEMQTADISHELSNYFQVDRGTIHGQPGVLDGYKAIIVARPTTPFTEQDKFVLDQYIMKGGKVLWLVDAVNVNPDSLASGATFGFINNLSLDDQLFTYGVRINPNLVQDIQCNVLPISAGGPGEQARWVPTPWLYYPLISPIVDHPITRSLNLVWAKYASQIDTLSVPNIKKTELLKTSVNTKLINVPVYIKLEDVKKSPVQTEFNKQNVSIAVLLEGQFPSVFRNRMVNNIIPGSDAYYKAKSVPTKMIVVADGDLIANDVRITPKGPSMSPLGYDKYTRQTFGNKEFIVNAVNYLTDETGLISLRGKEFKLRILNKALIRDDRLEWQILNAALPILLVILFGVYYHYSRKKKYTKSL